jgi:hypothetical protein
MQASTARILAKLPSVGSELKDQQACRHHRRGQADHRGNGDPRQRRPDDGAFTHCNNDAVTQLFWRLTGAPASLLSKPTPTIVDVIRVVVSSWIPT